MTSRKSFRARTPRPGRLLGALALLLLLAAPSSRLRGQASESLTGRWLIDFEEDGSVQLTLKHGARGHGNWSSSHDYLVREFQGLRRPAGATDVHARFELRRDAGTVAFEGRLNETGGSGRFSFAPSADYLAALQTMGYQRPDGETVFSLAVHDVSRAFIGELEGLGYRRLPLDDLVSMRIHGASPEFVRELKALGYEHLSPDDLVSMRIHGVAPEFIRDLQGLGYRNVSADELVSMRIHGVSIDFVKKMKARFKDVSADDLVDMRIHGR